MNRALLTTLLLSAMALAGCTGNGDAPVQEADFKELELEATPDTGIIRGVVVDSAIRPVADAVVSIRGPSEATMTTKADGIFGFDELAPGTYFVQASKSGLKTTQQSVEVVANVKDPKAVKLLMEVDPASRPYLSVFKFEGFLECNFTTVVLRIAACSLSPVGNDEFLAEYTLDQVPNWLQSELIWESTQALGDEMQISITDFSGEDQVRINASAGKSPQHITVNRTTSEFFRLGAGNTAVIRVFNDAVDETDVVPEDQVHDAWAGLYPTYNSTAPDPVKDQTGRVLAEDCVKYPTLFDACLGIGGVGATLQQEFVIYTHVFYFFDPPEGWRFTDSGDPPQPA